MAIYNPASLKAEEFISDAEIRETLAYAEANKHNLPLIEALLEKARMKLVRQPFFICTAYSRAFPNTRF